MKLGLTTAVVAALLTLSACGSDDAKASAGAASPSPSTDFSNIPGMAMGAPPQTLSQNCDGTSCDLVFIPPSKETGNPYGVTVGLVSADPAKAVITVAGKQYTLAPGKAVHAGGLTITMVGTPGASVSLSVKKA